ncbi:winged helix-turn-helix transcriptional regulator [Salmonella enterica subsp. enterica serovar Newport]|nr:Lrp/AsnC family transcriptional regulator [Salmonella enterica subsp. enterica serovar Newport]EAW4711835.1 Lrp/AsnC family transcriptional regulator [Salmonella enterica]ECI3719285.1 Lrp/AsnC family transcriptional regulator [Salmonella enterica subsp. enterica]ECN0311634.1 Lrp/AsnC family transcriptional regulator [Salmonella enterica subsp. enterica serovar Typhi]EJN2870397.1 Lrp/AsnC family transcriptional regulator [Salmonella enterica subsp. enterica serovar Techimani]
MKLDAWDKNILTLLQRDNRLSQREIAEQVNLSPSAVNRRIAALEEAGIIKGNISLIDAGKVGRPVTIVVQVVIENERFNLLEEARQRFVSCPQVQQVYYVTGDFDFLLVLNVRDMAEYETLTRELFFSSGNIKSFKTIVVMQNAKQEMRVLIE